MENLDIKYSYCSRVFTEVEMTKVGLRTNRSRNKKEQDDHVIQEGKSADIENNIASVGPELLNLRYSFQAIVRAFTLLLDKHLVPNNCNLYC